MRSLAGLLSGLLFGFGLALSGMTDSNNVLGFLDMGGAWQPALAFVMGSAVLVTLIGFRAVRYMPRPVFASGFHLPPRRTVDARLLLGAALFGIGWGLYGYCPGPAIVSVLYGEPDTLLFIVAMLVGMFLSNKVFHP
ncbi:MAG: DUF6691 family protein [Pseudomonadota bacterium]